MKQNHFFVFVSDPPGPLNPFLVFFVSADSKELKCSGVPRREHSADSIVRRRCQQSGFDSQVWQFPVVLIPLGDAHAPDSIVLRPIHSVDGMTAQAVAMPQHLLREITADILAIEGVCGVFYDLTNKPPATIEWE